MILRQFCYFDTMILILLLHPYWVFTDFGTDLLNGAKYCQRALKKMQMGMEISAGDILTRCTLKTQAQYLFSCLGPLVFIVCRTFPLSTEMFCRCESFIMEPYILTKNLYSLECGNGSCTCVKRLPLGIASVSRLLLNPRELSCCLLSR